MSTDVVISVLYPFYESNSLADNKQTDVGIEFFKIVVTCEEQVFS